MKNKNILLCWLSGSWKTTLAKYLNEKYWYELLKTSDEIHNYLRKKYPFIFKKWETNLNSFSYNLTQIVTKVIQSVDVILKLNSEKWLVFDSCNLKNETREKILKILWKDSIIIEVCCDEEEYLKRFKERKNFETWFELHKKQKLDFEKPNSKIIFNNSENDFSWFDNEFLKLKKVKN